MTHLFATDLDGTILASNHLFNPKDVEVLELLGQQNVVRVVATGRSLNSVLNVMPLDFPIDYLVFSSGAGIYCWNKKQLLASTHLGFELTQRVTSVLNQQGIEYTVHASIPNNHLFHFSKPERLHPDFLRYLKLHHAHAKPLGAELAVHNYTQTMAFVDDLHVFTQISKMLPEVKVVRATSPLDGQSIWMECFHPSVSKAQGILWVAELTNVDVDNVVVLGNDYNDLDMLNCFKQSFVVANAPEELTASYQVVADVYSAPLCDWYQRFN